MERAVAVLVKAVAVMARAVAAMERVEGRLVEAEEVLVAVVGERTEVSPEVAAVVRLVAALRVVARLAVASKGALVMRARSLGYSRRWQTVKSSAASMQVDEGQGWVCRRRM